MEASKKLGPLHVAAVVVGAIVGVGIFFTPAKTAKELSSPTWVMIAWTIGGIVAVCGALTFASLGKRHPHAGGAYVFLREAFGSKVAFLYGWLQLLVVQPGGMAIVALILVDHAARLGFPIAWRTPSAAIAIAIFALLNLIGMRAGGRVQIVMSAMKIAALVSIVVVGFAFGNPARFAETHVVARSWIAGLLLAIVPIHFTFSGAYHGNFIAGSVRDPERNVPRGIVLGIAIVLACYLGANAAYLGLLGHDRLAASESPGADAIAIALGGVAERAFAAIVVVSAAGILNTICLGFPFVLYAMAKDKCFFRAAGVLDARTGRPSIAVLVQGAVACLCVLTLSRHIDAILRAVAFAEALFQAGIAMAELRFHRSSRPVRIRSLPAWIFLLIEGAIAIGCLIGAPIESAFGIALLLVGVLTMRFAVRQ